MSNALVDWLFKIGLVLALAGGIGGWYYWNVERPQDQLAELTIKYDEQKVSLDTALTVNGEQNAVIVTLRESAKTNSETIASISKDCTVRTAKLVKLLAVEGDKPSTPIEGHGPESMNKFYTKHYTGE